MSDAELYEIERLPIIVSFEERAAFSETYGFSGSQGVVFLEGQRVVPKMKPSDTVIIFMHPASTLNLMPLPVGMAQAGHHVLCAASRYAKNDTALIMEKVVADLGAYIRHAREVLGYKNIVLGGWSGGGSLAAFYQSEAENPTIASTPAGDAYDLTKADLQPADALMLIAAHIGRARTLSEWIDPSVKDENTPERRDNDLDIYAKSGPKPPFSENFMVEYRAAQRARVDKISNWVRNQLDTLKRQGGLEIERGFVVHRTMADPRFLDPLLEPNGRKPSWCYLGNPETVNTGPVGLARFSTLRAWLSQWCPDCTNANAVKNISGVSVPFLILENEADDCVPISHPSEIFAAADMADKTYVKIVGATHYYKDQQKHLNEAVAAIKSWLAERGFAD